MAPLQPQCRLAQPVTHTQFHDSRSKSACPRPEGPVRRADGAPRSRPEVLLELACHAGGGLPLVALLHLVPVVVGKHHVDGTPRAVPSTHSNASGCSVVQVAVHQEVHVRGWCGSHKEFMLDDHRQLVDGLLLEEQAHGVAGDAADGVGAKEWMICEHRYVRLCLELEGDGPRERADQIHTPLADVLLLLPKLVQERPDPVPEWPRDVVRAEEAAQHDLLIPLCRQPGFCARHFRNDGANENGEHHDTKHPNHDRVGVLAEVLGVGAHPAEPHLAAAPVQRHRVADLVVPIFARDCMPSARHQVVK
mmetsp:Transcript_88782/g.259478  ORF Transcript_88782/g.259478 Transcript_88782/m.259478 type:complete len:306 (-) Transcript_88782:1113-2030(-)